MCLLVAVLYRIVSGYSVVVAIYYSLMVANRLFTELKIAHCFPTKPQITSKKHSTLLQVDKQHFQQTRKPFFRLILQESSREGMWNTGFSFSCFFSFEIACALAFL